MRWVPTPILYNGWFSRTTPPTKMTIRKKQKFSRPGIFLPSCHFKTPKCRRYPPISTHCQKDPAKIPAGNLFPYILPPTQRWWGYFFFGNFFSAQLWGVLFGLLKQHTNVIGVRESETKFPAGNFFSAQLGVYCWWRP